ncbi:MAG: hypothetical protein HRT73_04100 [Flavobacteriales bacterium]|nr:hypothetical protein [Flavobacteriales bacterium]
MKKIFSFILSLVILVTSMGFTISSHICGGHKVKSVINIGITDVSCGMEKKKSDCETKSQMKDDCCQDEFQLIQNDEDYIQQITDFNFSDNFLIAFVTSYVELLDTETTEIDFYADHSPPPLIKDIPVLIQSFLI